MNTKVIWQATADFRSQLPTLEKHELMGYYNISNTIPANTSGLLMLAGGFWILHTSVSAFDAIFNAVLNIISTL